VLEEAFVHIFISDTGSSVIVVYYLTLSPLQTAFPVYAIYKELMKNPIKLYFKLKPEVPMIERLLFYSK
jgi:hypothetical protein